MKSVSRKILSDSPPNPGSQENGSSTEIHSHRSNPGSGLSREQREVIESRANIRQIIAAAGSGKTRTVIELARRLLLEAQCCDVQTERSPSMEKLRSASGRVEPPQSIRKDGPSVQDPPPGPPAPGNVIPEVDQGHSRPLLLLTFSRKACQEMLDRLGLKQSGLAEVHTFHGFCYQMIRRYHPEGQRLRVVEDEEKLNILRPLFYRHRLEIGGIPYSLLLAHPNRFRGEFPNAAFRIFRYWEQYKDRHGLLEYSDLIRIMLRGLRSADDESWAHPIPGSFVTIIVDEFQDTDDFQLEFLKLMQSRNLVVVGDDWQGIYSFRGANIRPFLDFKKHFPGTQKHFLSINFRSVPGIVKAGNRLIRASGGQIRKKVHPHRSASGESVLSVTTEGGREQSFLQMLQQCRLSWTILCRSNYRKSIWLEAGANDENCLTIHRSKGLEFQLVILDVLGGWSGAADPEARDEEVRIAYVALTRAMDLFIALHRKDYGSRAGDAWVWNQLFHPICKRVSPENLEERIFGK